MWVGRKVARLQYSLIKGFVSPYMSCAIDQPSHVQHKHTPEHIGGKKGVPPGLPPAINWHHCRQENRENRIQNLVVSETITQLAQEPIKIIHHPITYCFWNMTNQSASISLISMVLPLAMTAGCFLLINQPTWEKKKPRCALWGSASVSLYLWCCLWSRTQMYKQFYKKVVEISLKVFENGVLIRFAVGWKLASFL